MALPIAYPTPNAVAERQMKAFALTPRHRQAIRAWRYYDGSAYNPAYGRQFPHPYTEWDEVTNGPRPAIMPLPKLIVETGAQFLFAEAPRFTVGESKPSQAQGIEVNPLQDLLDDILQMNAASSRWLSRARACGIEGGIVFKFAWTPQVTQRPVSIHTLSPYDVTFLRDDLDPDLILMARIQFKYYSPEQDQWYLYREDWYPDRQIIYRKLETSANDDSTALSQFIRGEWPREKTVDNPFGVIPLTPIYNKRVEGDMEGYGDYWDLFILFDQYNHTNWLEHHSNQFDLDRMLVVINSQFDGSIKPGAALQLQGQNSDAKWLEAKNDLRPAVQQFKYDLRREILNSAGIDDHNPETITNKGNLTRAVWEMVFAKTLKTTNEKREYWGEHGLCLFFETLFCGLSRLPDARIMYPALRKVVADDLPTYDVQVHWPDLFRVTPEERSETLKDLQFSVQSGFLTRERAVDQSAKVWGIKDVSQLKKELSEQHEMLDAQDEAQTQAAINQAKAIGQQADTGEDGD